MCGCLQHISVANKWHWLSISEYKVSKNTFILLFLGQIWFIIFECICPCLIIKSSYFMLIYFHFLVMFTLTLSPAPPWVRETGSSRANSPTLWAEKTPGVRQFSENYQPLTLNGQGPDKLICYNQSKFCIKSRINSRVHPFEQTLTLMRHIFGFGFSNNWLSLVWIMAAGAYLEVMAKEIWSMDVEVKKEQL